MNFFKGNNFSQCVQRALDAGMIGPPDYCFRSDKGWRMGWLK